LTSLTQGAALLAARLELTPLARLMPGTQRWSRLGGSKPAIRRMAVMGPLQYAVGIKLGNKADQVAVEADDALIAALKAKLAHPEATITYVRKRNARGDRRHPHSGLIGESPAA
jgi:hypothetical protein